MRIFISVFNLTNGGAERVACLWANGFQQMGHEVILILGDDTQQITYWPDKGIKIESICSHQRNKIYRTIDRIRNFRKLIVLYKPDLIIGVLSTLPLIAKFTFIGKKITIINTEHNSFERPVSAPMPYITKFYKFVINKVYDCVTVLTSADKDVIGNRIKKVFVLPNPCTFDQIESKKIANKKKIILASGRLDVWHCKGFDLLIKAFGIARKEISGEWVLQIAGQGSPNKLEYLQRLAKEYGVYDSVRFLGYIPNLQEKFEEASIFVLSSRYEGFGMVLLEAMSQGCACIACDFKGRQAEILGNPAAGLLCKPESESEIASRIVELCNDEALRDNYQRSAIHRSKNFSLSNIMAKWDKIVSRI